jgi:LysR family transcriptional regulator, transcriptional activator of nhaA
VEWLNYHHLLYFWVVAKEGSIARASAELRLAQPTISGQIRALEESLGEQLFERKGRGLVLTERGRIVFRFADEIFRLGRELTETLRGLPGRHVTRFTVGVADVVPKLIAHRLLEPALAISPPVRLICYEDTPERLLAELSMHHLDLVLSDAPLGQKAKVRAYNHLLGECGVTLFGAPSLASTYQRGFPESLDGAPLLFPTEGTTLRRSLDQWCEAQGIRPAVVAEFQDSALLNVFGQRGAGLFPAPSAIEKEVATQYEVRVVGRIDAIREHFFAISVERKIRNPAAIAISEAARRDLFG